MFNAFRELGGSEWEAYELSSNLGKITPTSCWSVSSRPHAQWRRRGIRMLGPLDALQMKDVNAVHVGTYWTPKPWARWMKLHRRIVLVNTFDFKATEESLRLLASIGPCPELVYISDFQRRIFGRPGEVHPSPVDLERFRPRERDYENRFIVGRLSRDEFNKHHLVEDPRLYRALNDKGIPVRLMGATCMRPLLADLPNTSILPSGSMHAEDFLQSIDCFYYWPGTFLESFGRVILEAMACGLPVVANRYGGYAEYIDDGQDGFLFDRPDEALEMIARLHQEPDLRRRVGEAAVAKARAIYAPQALAERNRFYCRD